MAIRFRGSDRRWRPTMTERGITYNRDSVLRILDPVNPKTHTIRPIKPQPRWPDGEPDRITEIVGGIVDGTGRWIKFPYGYEPGDRLYGREVYVIESSRLTGHYPPPHYDGRPTRWVDDPEWGRYWEQVHYRATDPTPELAYEDSDEPECRWRAPFFLPRDLARIHQEITSLGAGRVQSIDYETVLREGVTEAEIVAKMPLMPVRAPLHELQVIAARFAFKDVWDSIYPPESPFAWDRNPWCWLIGTKLIGRGE